MADLHLQLREHGTAALHALDTLSAADPQVSGKLVEVMRHFLTMRDDLILAQRAGTPCSEELHRMNAIMSSIFGIEFPSGGLQWQRVADTREALRRLLAEATSQTAVNG